MATLFAQLVRHLPYTRRPCVLLPNHRSRVQHPSLPYNHNILGSNSNSALQPEGPGFKLQVLPSNYEVLGSNSSSAFQSQGPEFKTQLCLSTTRSWVQSLALQRLEHLCDLLPKTHSTSNEIGK